MATMKHGDVDDADKKVRDAMDALMKLRRDLDNVNENRSAIERMQADLIRKGMEVKALNDRVAALAAHDRAVPVTSLHDRVRRLRHTEEHQRRTIENLTKQVDHLKSELAKHRALGAEPVYTLADIQRLLIVASQQKRGSFKWLTVYSAVAAVVDLRNKHRKLMET